MKKYSTKKSLIASLLILCLSFSMLVGTTFAWFTDSVTSGNNVITTGNLDIELEYWDGDSWEGVAGTDKLFTGNLWEPGHTEIVYLRLSNLGSLALKYQLGINIVKEVEGINVAGKAFKLSDSILMGVVDGVNAETDAYTKDSAGRAQAIADAKEVGKINAGYTDGGYMLAGEEAAPIYMAVVVYMPTTVGNEANPMTGTTAPSIELGVNLIATQYTNESDSFDNLYDDGANFSDVVVNGKTVTLVAAKAPSTTTPKTKVEVPANAYAAGKTISIDVSTESSLFNITESGNVVGTIDVVLSVDGEAQSSELKDGKVYTVTTYIAKGLETGTIKVTYTGTDGRSQPTVVSYDPTDGKLVFTTTHFSEYEVTAKVVAYDVEKDEAYSTGAAVANALKAEDANVVIPESVPASDKVAIVEAVEAAVAKNEVKADVKVTIGGEECKATEVASGVEVITTVGELKAAIAEGGSVLLGANITLNETIEIANGVELDLGKYTITANVNKARAFKVVANEVDFVLNANGATVNFGNGTYGVIEIGAGLDGVNVTVNGGIFAGTTEKGAFVKLRDGSNHTVVLNNVNYTENCEIAVGNTNAYIMNTAYVALENYSLAINGGTYNVAAGIGVSAGVKLSMNGVKLTAKGVAVEANNAEIVNCKINVNPGEYTGTIDAAGVIVNANGKIVVKGTEINSEAYGLEVSSSGGTIVAENCDIKAKLGNRNCADENGKLEFVGLPTAWVEELDDLTVPVHEAGDITLDCGFIFLPTQTYEEALDAGYEFWHADFVVTVDKNVAEVGEAGLAGYYTAFCELIDYKWVAIPMDGVELIAGQEFRLVSGMYDSGITVNYGDICKYAIREENDGVDGFRCGAYADESMAGVTLTVELRLYEVGAKGDCEIGGGCNHPHVECETGNYIVIGSYSHTFDNK